MKPHHIIKSILPRTLYGRSLMIIVTPLILLQIISAWIFYDNHWDKITWRLANTIAGDVQNVIYQTRQNPDKMDDIFLNAKQAMELDFILRKGEILPNGYVQDDGLIDRLLSKTLRERLHRPFHIDSSSFEKEVVIDIQLKEDVLTIIVPGKRLFSTSTYIFIMWMVGSSLILFAVASIFMRNQIRPISKLATAVDLFGKGRGNSEDFKPEGASEVRRAAMAFNLMSQRIRRQIRQRTDMLSGVSHDLRTPLTRMKLQLALLGKGDDIDELSANVSEMEKMIDGYLTFARGEGGEVTIECDLTSIVNDIGARWKNGGVNIDYHVEGNIISWLKPNAFRRCLNNLIANANLYADNIWVSVGKRGDAIEILIDDNGCGIAEKDREDVFKPFFRLDRSRNIETGGTGLGLSIARDITRVHGGNITLEDSPYGGLRAKIRLPI